MENEQVEQVKRETSDTKGQLLSSIGLFIGMGLSPPQRSFDYFLLVEPSV